MSANTAAISDPSEFSSSLVPELTDLDKHMRCNICKEIMRDAMIASCGHSFCAICVHTAKTSSNQCPECRVGDITRLTKNWFAREVIAWWHSQRDKFLTALTTQLDKQKVMTQPSAPSRKRDIADVADAEAPRYKTRGAARKPAPEPVVIRDSEDESEEEERDEAKRKVPCPLCGDKMRNEQVYAHLDSCSQNPDATAKAPKGLAPALE